MTMAVRFGTTTFTGDKATFLPAMQSLQVLLPENSSQIVIQERGDQVSLKLTGGYTVESTISTYFGSILNQAQPAKHFSSIQSDSKYSVFNMGAIIPNRVLLSELQTSFKNYLPQS